MTSARSLYRLHLAVAGTAALVLLGALGLVARALEFDTGDGLASFASACRGLLPDLEPAPLAVLGLLVIASIVSVRAARSALRHALASRRLELALRPARRISVDGCDVTLVQDRRPQAFCAGLFHPRVCVSTGALLTLEDDELRAVVTHERHHQRRRDPLRMLVAEAVGDGFFFLPALRRMARRYGELAELAADEAAVRHLGDPAPLASALLSFGERSGRPVVVGIAAERVDHLLGRRPRWELPVTILAAAGVTIAGMVAMVALAAQVMPADTLSVSAVLMQACAAAMVAIPFGLTTLGLTAVRSRRVQGSDGLRHRGCYGGSVRALPKATTTFWPSKSRSAP